MTLSIFNTARFRYAAALALLFAVAALILSGLLYFGVRESMEQQLRDQVSAEARQLFGDYKDEGIDELIHDIGERLERSTRSRLYFSIENAEGVALFDRFGIPKKTVGAERQCRAAQPLSCSPHCWMTDTGLLSRLTLSPLKNWLAQFAKSWSRLSSRC